MVIGSRRIERAQAVIKRVVDHLRESDPNFTDDLQPQLTPAALISPSEALAVASNADVIFSAGAAGVEFLDERWPETQASVLIDLNAVPPAGIANVPPTAAGTKINDKICYGAIGVGELKMRIHKRAISRLFESNDQVLDTQAIYKLGTELAASEQG